jgi:hypothetical protein
MSQPSHREIARTVGTDLAGRDEVDAVLLVGSTATGHADEYADVDLKVVGSESGERTVEGVHVEWTATTHEEIESELAGWTDDAALYTYATAEVLADDIGLADLLADFAQYPDDVRREKLYAGWFHGTGSAFDARKAAKRGAPRARRASAVAAVEQFAALAYVLDEQFSPYRKWLFRELPTELPEIDDALAGDVEALDALRGTLEPRLREVLEDERVEKPYLHQPEFGPLG